MTKVNKGVKQNNNSKTHVLNKVATVKQRCKAKQQQFLFYTFVLLLLLCFTPLF
jgi:hypothetical protein